MCDSNYITKRRKARGFLTFILLCVIGSTCTYAQNEQDITDLTNKLSLLKKNIHNNNVDVEGVRLSPYVFRLLQPNVFSSKAVGNVMKLDSMKNDNIDDVNAFIDDQLIDIYLNAPSKVGFSNDQVEKEAVAPDNPKTTNTPISHSVEDLLNNELQVVNIKDIDDNIDDIGIVIKKPNFWKTSGSASLQFTQNYFSENWYKGGNNNQNLLASLILQANYNDQKKLTWDNKLEMRLGFMTTTSDSCHKFLTSNDKINLHSKLGIKATKAWYYTATAEANSQFMPGYKSNDKKTYSSFLAPLDVFISIGMDFKPALKNGNSFSLALLPLSYKWRHLRNRDENIHSVYNMVGINTKRDYGSKMELNSTIKLAKDFVWKCRCYYYTSYSYAEAELENRFTYAFSKYINAELYTLWRFDDNRARKYYDENLGYFQFKEYFTLGVTYAF